MTIVSAAIMTILLLVISQAISTGLHFPFSLILIPATAFWATLESISLRRLILAHTASTEDQDIAALLQTTRPIVVFTACLIFWHFGFPWYLLMREKLLSAAKKGD
jgi:hypothetical protein